MIALIKRGFQAIRLRLSDRPDTEHEQALVRLAVGSVFFFYLLPKALQEQSGFDGINHQFLAVMVSFLVVSLGIFVSILVRTDVSVVRRVLGAFLDSAAVTYFMSETDVYGIPLFLVYVWTTLGNGFRYGPAYLLSSLAFNVIGFSVVLLISPFWAKYLEAGIGMMIGMTALSLYVLSLVKRMFDALNYAEAANRAKRRFISVVSHEMRTPLNAIIGMSDLLRESNLNREQADMVQTMSASSRILLGLVEDVLDFSKIESGKLNIEHTDFDVHALINSTCRIIQPQAEGKGLELQVSIMPEVPPALRGDPHHLRQVLINLAGNAVKFTEQGSVTVHVSLLEESDETVKLKFSVRDTGIGISQEAQNRIFESFVQADQSTTRRFGGTGLGTTIAKQLVELMGGRMGLESAVGLGSTFWFELGLQKQPGATGEPAAGELRDVRIILVGFPSAEQQSLLEMLQGWHARPITAGSPEEALARAKGDPAGGWHSMLVYSASAAAGRHVADQLQSVRVPLVLCADSRFWKDAEPRAGNGFTAALTLPIQKRMLFNVLHSVSAVEEPTGTSSVVQLRDYFKHRSHAQQYRIVVADDSMTNRQVIGKILERGGHTVTLLEDGEDALDALESAQFDLVILDRNMPGMGGIETLRAIRLMNLGQGKLPVVILSADVTSETREDCMSAGADAFLPKPVEAVRLLDAVAELCSGNQVKSGSGRMDSAPRLAASADSLNVETLQLLEGLGSQDGFLERLVSVFLSDNEQLLDGMEKSLGNRDIAEFRKILHAMKGSAASIGAERLAQSCSDINARSDAEMRLQSRSLVDSIRHEFDAARAELGRYMENRQRTTG